MDPQDVVTGVPPSTEKETAANAESVVVAVGASVAQDAAGNENTAATSLTVSVAPADTTGPDLTVTSPAANARVVNALSQTIAGGCESGGTAVSFSVDGGTPVTTSCGSNGTYSQAVSLSSPDGNKTVEVFQGDGNGNTSRVSVAFTLDQSRPTVALSRSGTEAASGPFDVTVTFNENVTGLRLAEVGVTGGTATGTFPTEAEDVFTVRVTPAANAESVVVAVSASVAQDAAGNGNTAATSLTVSVMPADNTGPNLTVTSPAANARVVNALSQTIAGGCEAGGTAVSFSVDGGTPVTTSCGSNGTYSQAVSLSSPDGNKTVEVSQGDGNGNTSRVSVAFTLDQSRPTVALTRSGTEAVSGPFDVTVTFNENVTGLTLAEVGVTGGTATGTFPTEAEDVFTVRVTPNSNVPSVVVAVGASVAQDAAGNENTAATSLTVSVAPADRTGPNLTVTSPAANARVVNALSQTIAGGCESGGTAVSLTVDGGTPVTTSCGSNGTYRRAVSLSAGDGNKSVEVSQGDGNGNTSRVSVAFTLDQSRPTVVLSRSGTEAVSGPFDVTVTFNENVTGFTLTEVGVTGGTATGTFPTEAEDVFTVRITPVANAESMVVAIGASVAQDAAGNGNTAATSLTVSVAPADTTGPNLTVTSPAANARVVNALSQTISGGCEAGGTDVSFSVDGGTPVTTSCGSNGTYRRAVSLSVGDGNKTVEVSQGDGNGNTSRVSVAFTLDPESSDGGALSERNGGGQRAL